MAFIDDLKQNDLIYFIYRSDLSIFGLPSPIPGYFVVRDNKYKVPKEIKIENENDVEHITLFRQTYIIENQLFTFINTQLWFDMILNNDIACWSFSCAKPKNIIKEHVKCLLTLDPLKVRQNAEFYLEKYFMQGCSYVDGEKRAQAIIQFYKGINVINLGNQIIENHKIVNYQESMPVWETLSKQPLDKVYECATALLVTPEKRLNKLTDYLIQKQKIDKIKDERSN